MLTWSGLLLLTFVTFSKGHDQTISTQLVAPWAPTSLLDEAAQFLGDVHSSLYWEFIDSVIEKLDSLPSPKTDDGQVDLASVAAFNLVSASKLRMMEWALRSRAYSPKVLLLQELAPFNVPAECKETFALVGEEIICDFDKLDRSLSSVTSDNVLITENDHKYPSPVWSQGDNPPIVILYGNLQSSLSRQFHQLLKKASHNVGYVFRPIKPKETKEKLLLAGYGIELMFKSQEYKAQDDSGININETEVSGILFHKLNELYPELSEELDRFQNFLATESGKKSGFEALKAWQVQELGLQASHYTTLQDDVLENLMDVSGNFPSRAGSLSSIRVPTEFKKAVSYNQRLLATHFNLEEGEGAFFLQGSFLDPDSLDLFTFMDTLKGELEFMELLRSVRFERPDMKREEVNRILSLGTKTAAEPELALDLRDSSIFWINDLEKDEEYEDWPDDLTQLFFRMGGIMLRPVRRNVFNLVLTVNPEDTASTGSLLKLAQSFMAHKSPVRIGLVFCSSDKKATNEDSRTRQILRIMNYAAAEGKSRKAFQEVVHAFLSDDFSKLDAKFQNPGEEFDFGVDLACDFVKRGGREAPAAFLNGVPLKWDSIDDFEEVVLNQLLREAQAVQIEAYNGRVGDATDIFEYLMTRPNVQTRLNDKILDTSNSKYISFGTERWEPGTEVKNSVGKLATSLNYLLPSGKRHTPVTISFWAFADPTSISGNAFLKTALEFLSESATHTRITFISTCVKKCLGANKLQNAFSTGDVKEIEKLLENALANKETAEDEDNPLGSEFMKLVEVGPGDMGVVVNGRLIGPLPEQESFQSGDWSLVQKFTYDACAKYLDGEDWDADSVMRVCSALGSPFFKKNSKRFTLPSFQSPFKVGKETSDVFHIDLTAVIDPASRHAHKMAALMSAVKDIIGNWVHMQIIYNPPSKHSELPLKSYYRFVAGHTSGERVTFEEIPRDPLFTQNIFTPDNWMVEVVKCEKDLDNIRLRDMQGSVESEYELEHLLVEGHCLEMKSGSPPRGLQFTLTPQSQGVEPSETIVMANLGYYQLKAKPGLWTLGLREGPSREIFALESQNMKPISVNSFQSIVLKVKVKRNPGKDTASLLDSEEEAGGWFGFGSKKPEADEETINVFSLASGHLYERVLKIMMLSVRKNTKSKVKFWFLKNYLSPTLKDILPAMAKEYDFDYELVQYHWPRWLNPQREKQRIIWGYKILFLDVLFPLSLKKIVFVDADQVVRADLNELFKLDLEGNPYGYAPFCDSRVEMEGFRFWKHGYWKSHLGRRKYHISALYVVDLLRFRRIAAGDRLRGQYQALSQDPNSLSNLDQDLPNNMIHQVGIKTLPQEWLWCETWCDDASKKNAKTIDLCNNPQTKEPKLDAAQRIVPEWKDYDQEIKDFQARILTENQRKFPDSKSHSDTHYEL